jgi:hypothetical protein
MQTASRRRTTWAVTASVLAHALVITIVALQKPMLKIPPEVGAPPPAIIPVLLLPRTPPVAGQKEKPQPIRLHRRPQPFVPPEVTPAPIAPPAPAGPAPPAPRAPVTVLHPAPLPQGPKGDVRQALRQGPVGCANPDAVGLTKAERDLCDEKFGKGVRTATPYGTGMELTAEKRRLLDAQAAQREEEYRYKHDQTPPSPTAGSQGTAGATAEEQCKSLGIPPEKCGVSTRR